MVTQTTNQTVDNNAMNRSRIVVELFGSTRGLASPILIPAAILLET